MRLSRRSCWRSRRGSHRGGRVVGLVGGVRARAAWALAGTAREGWGCAGLGAAGMENGGCRGEGSVV